MARSTIMTTTKRSGNHGVSRHGRGGGREAVACEFVRIDSLLCFICYRYSTKILTVGRYNNRFFYFLDDHRRAAAEKKHATSELDEINRP